MGHATFEHTVTEEPGVIVHDHCPFDYCKPDSILPLNLKHPDDQCDFNRSGILCGACHGNFSQVLGAATKCKIYQNSVVAHCFCSPATKWTPLLQGKKKIIDESMNFELLVCILIVMINTHAFSTAYEARMFIQVYKSPMVHVYVSCTCFCIEIFVSVHH